MSVTNKLAQRRSRTGAALDWVRLIAATAGEMYLIIILVLLAIAFVPAVFGWQATVVQTGSMRPHVDPGDVVVTSPWSYADPVPLGGVISFRSPAEAESDGTEKIRLHRIVGVNEGGTFVTAGDANAEVDSTPLTREQITGQARILVPFIGLPSLWIGTAQARPLLLWSLFTVLALWAVHHGHRLRDEEPTPEDHSDAFAERTIQPTLHRRAALGVLGAAAIGVLLLRNLPSSSAAFTSRNTNAGNTWSVAPAAVPSLGRAASYLLLASTAIRRSSWFGWNTWIDGSVGTSPGTTIEGLQNSGLFFRNVAGSIDRNTSVARNAMADARILYDSLRAQPKTATIPSRLTGTRTPGSYQPTSGSLAVSGTLTLDAQGDPSARFIFRADRITVESRATIRMINGTNPSNIFWVASTDIELGSNSTSTGNFLAARGAILREGITLQGRAITLNGSIELAEGTVSL